MCKLRICVVVWAVVMCAVGCSDNGSGEGEVAADTGVVAVDVAVDQTPARDTTVSEEDTTAATDSAAVDVEEEETGPELEPGMLLIDPMDPVIELGVDEERDLSFTLMVVNDEGEPEEVQALWELDARSVGAFDRATLGLFKTNGAGGQVTVTATWQDQTVQTSLTVQIVGVFADPLGEPEDVDAFEGMENTDPGAEPRLIYPETGTIFPQNLTGITFQWDEGVNTLFRVRFSSEFLDVTTTTRLSVWEAPAPLWRTVVRSLRANEKVEVSVEGVDRFGDVSRTMESVQVGFSSDTVSGAIYYWSTADAGIMRLPVGETEPEPFFTPGSPSGSPCVGCHALSRDGKRVAFNTGVGGLPFPIGPFIQVMADDPTEVVTPLSQNFNGMQPTFSPDGSSIVTGWEGVLTERNSDGTCTSEPSIVCSTPADCPNNDCVTGQPIGTVPVPEGWKGGFPDWAPDDSYLVGSMTNFFLNIGIDFEMPNSGLFLVPRENGAWGVPEILLTPRNQDERSGHPAVSPDSRWIVFDHMGGGYPGSQGSVVQSDLWIMSPNERVPIPLSRADQNLGNINTWAKWAPFHGQHLWLAFSSTRPYGKVSVASPQIWVTALDPARAAQGEDPSYPAFWLPSQSPDSGNHVPYWAPFSKEPAEEEEEEEEGEGE